MLETMTTFEEYFGILAQSTAVTSPAEIHGVLAALICVNRKPTKISWFNAVLKVLEGRVGGLSPKIKSTVMLNLYDETYRQLMGISRNFQLLLPNEQYSFEERAKALSRWCQGFMYGLGLREATMLEESVSDTVLEALHCINDIAVLDFSGIDVSDADRNAYFGVVDFVEDAVLTIYEEFQNEKEESSGSNKKKQNYLH